MDREYLTDRPDVAGAAESPWLAGRGRMMRPPLTGQAVCDVVVIGGGLCGVLTAHRLVQAGARVTLLEARRIAGGVTGHTTAKATAQHDIVSANLGVEEAAQWVQANVAAVDRLESLANLVGGAAAFSRIDSHIYVAKPSEVQKLEHEAHLFHDLGLEGGMVPESDLPRGALAALRLAGQAQIDPVGLVDGLIDLAPESLVVHEGSHVREVAEGSDFVVVRTDGGEVRADSAIVASHVPFFDTLLYMTRLFQERTYAFEVQVDQPAPSGMWYSPDGDAVSWRPLGPDGDQRLVISGVHHKAGQGGDERQCYTTLGQLATQQLGALEVHRHWSTQDAQTPDHLPLIGKMHGRDRVFMATGFQGWGMTTSVVASDILSVLAAGEAHHGLSHLVTPARLAATGAAKLALENADFLVKGVSHEIVAQGDPSAVAPGSGQAMRSDVGHVAVARAQDGTLHISDAHCTHMRCGVEFNEAEETWDCPCHGSRFLADGTWLHGPTRRGLDPAAEADQRAEHE